MNFFVQPLAPICVPKLSQFDILEEVALNDQLAEGTIFEAVRTLEDSAQMPLDIQMSVPVLVPEDVVPSDTADTLEQSGDQAGVAPVLGIVEVAGTLGAGETGLHNNIIEPKVVNPSEQTQYTKDRSGGDVAQSNARGNTREGLIEYILKQQANAAATVTQPSRDTGASAFISSVAPSIGDVQLSVSPKLQVVAAGGSEGGQSLTAMVRELGQPVMMSVQAHFSGLSRSDSLTSDQAQRIWAQVRDKLQDIPRGQVIVEVNPPDVGKLRVAFDLTRDVAQIAVVSERADYLNAMRRAADILGQEVKAMGYDGVEFTFSSQNSSSSHEEADFVDPSRPEATDAAVGRDDASLSNSERSDGNTVIVRI